MSLLKRFIFPLLLNYLEILLLIFLLTIIYYYDYLSTNTTLFIELLIVLITTFINSFTLGKKTRKKGYINGLKYGLLFITIPLLITIYLKRFSLKLLLYYPLIISTCIIGSIFGISQKKTTN